MKKVKLFHRGNGRVTQVVEAIKKYDLLIRVLKNKEHECIAYKFTFDLGTTMGQADEVASKIQEGIMNGSMSFGGPEMYLTGHYGYIEDIMEGTVDVVDSIDIKFRGM